MRPFEIIDLIEKLEARATSYWNFYTVAIVAQVGWVISKDSGKLGNYEGWAIFIGAALFFFMNFSVLYPTTKRICLLERELKASDLEKEKFDKPLIDNLTNPFILYRLEATVVTHIAMDVLVLTFIYISTVYGFK